MSSKCFILRGSQIMMNFVLSKLRSLFDYFNHISNWPNKLALQYLRHQILVPGLHIRKSQISDCCFWVYLPLE